MATINQELAVDNIVKQVGKGGKASVSKAMRGIYSPSVAKNPKKLTQSVGFKELLKKNGLTEDLISKSLVADIKKKPQKRIEELKLGADILGMRKTGGNTVVPIQINFGDDGDKYA